MTNCTNSPDQRQLHRLNARQWRYLKWLAFFGECSAFNYREKQTFNALTRRNLAETDGEFYAITDAGRAALDAQTGGAE